MANYQKTQELFNGEPNREPGLKYEKSCEQLAEEKWFAQVKNTPSTLAPKSVIFECVESKKIWFTTFLT
jgi:hypothetical protein